MVDNTLTYRQIAKMIDISAVQVPQGEQEIREMVKIAQAYGFGAVHVLPAWVALTRFLLVDSPDISLGGPVGFPSGGSHTSIKLAEAQQLIADGVDEFDIMLNVGKLRSGDDPYVLSELRMVISAVNVPVKVILETHYLNNDQIRRACALCIKAGAAFVKTSTGWTATGATLDNVRLIAECVENRIGIKASGGIRDFDTLMQMYALGVRRFGINMQAAVDIVQAARLQNAGSI